MAFGYYKKHTVIIAPSLSDYPALLPTGPDADLRDEANGGLGKSPFGFDQRTFETTALDDPRPFELVNYNAATGEKEMYVKHSCFGTGTETILALGDDTIVTDGSDPATVWGGFSAVLHLSDGSTLSLVDSSPEGSDGTNSGATATSGKIDGGAAFDGSGQYFTLNDSGALSPGSGDFTVSLWFQTAGGSSTEWLYADYGSSGNAVVKLSREPSGAAQFQVRDDSGNESIVANTASLSDNVLYHLVGVKIGTNAYLYLNGALVGSDSNASLGTVTTSDGSAPAFGTYGYFPGIIFNLNGKLDEFRFNQSGRAGDWIGADHDNQSDPDAYWDVDAAVSLSSGPTFPWPHYAAQMAA